ncbi:MAG: glycosyltransferase family 4 protein [Candidatus Methanomethyliaceae archaeon]
MTIKVGFFLFFPPTLWVRGGGEVQLAKTKEALERFGVHVSLFDIWSSDSEFDLIHVFGSNYEVASFVKSAKERMPVVVSTIAYSSKPGWQWMVWKHINRCVPVETIYRLRQRIYEYADRLIVASRAEAKQLARNFHINAQKVRVVPHGVDVARFKTVKPDMFINRFGIQDFVLQVGRINRHKGQVRLIRALEGTGLQAVFIGPLDTGDPDEVAKFKALVDRHHWVHYLGAVSHDDPLLASAYAAARVCALPSISESFGLTVLEAIAAGTPVVCGVYPPIREYFGDSIYYCNPGSIESIQRNVLRAYEQGLKAGVREHVLNNFSWDQVGQRLLEIYKELVA